MLDTKDQDDVFSNQVIESNTVLIRSLYKIFHPGAPKVTFRTKHNNKIVYLIQQCHNIVNEKCRYFYETSRKLTTYLDNISILVPKMT